jgi:hypothetical protein
VETSSTAERSIVQSNGGVDMLTTHCRCDPFP